MTNSTEQHDNARQALIERGYFPDLSARSLELMRYACKDGVAEVVEAYLALGMSTETRDEWSKSTPVLQAVEGNQPAIVRMLAEAGADLDARDRDGDTPVHTAINWSHLDVARLLVELGAPLDTLNNANKTPLISALENNNEEAVELLLEGGADPEFCADGAVPPIFVALEFAPDLIDKLVDAGASIDAARPGDGNRPLMVAVAEGDADLAQKLLGAGADPATANAFGWTAAMIARWEGQTVPDDVLGAPANDALDERAWQMLDDARCREWSGLKSYTEAGGDPDLCGPDGRTLLMYAAEQAADDLSAVNLLIDAGASLDLVAAHGGTALACATDLAFDRLLSVGASPNERPGHSSVLLTSCYDEQPERVRKLIDAGANVDSRDASGTCALHNAASYDCTQTLQVLLDVGAHTEFGDTIGQTPLGYAVEWGKLEIVEALLAAGADVNGADPSDNTPLHLACKNHYTDVDQAVYVTIAGKLLEAGADCARVNHLGHTPVEAARFDQVDEMVALVSDFLTIDRLREAQASLGLDDEDRSPELYAALVETETAETLCEWIRREELEVALGLVEAGVVERIEPGPNVDPVLLAAREGYDEVLKALRNAGAPLEIESQYGHTPVIEAVINAHVRCVITLGLRHVDLDVRLDNQPLMVLAAGTGKLNLMEFLAARGQDADPLPAGASPLLAAVQGTSLEIVEWLIDQGVNVDVRDLNGRTALHHAVDAGRVDFVEALCKGRADVEAADRDGVTPLLLAAMGGEADIARILLQAGADPTATDNNGMNARAHAAGRAAMNEVLDEYASGEHDASDFFLDDVVDDSNEWSKLLECVYINSPTSAAELLDDGEDPNQTNYRGDSLLLIALKRSNAKIARLLCEAGADVTQEGGGGETPLAVALASDDEDLKALVEEFGGQMEMGALEAQVGVMSRQNEFVEAIGRGELVTVSHMLDEHRVDIHTLINGATPLGVAVSHGDAEMVDLLLAKGASILVSHFHTAVFDYASDLGEEDIASRIVTAGF